MSLENQVALVTGASRGIGRAIALELGRRGAQVVGTATTQAGADGITEQLQAQGLRGRGFVMNVASNESVQTALAAIQKESGVPSVLVNNAGITRDNLLMRMKDDEWEAVINTNLNALYRLTKACLRGMIKAKYGRIINIASVVALSGNPGQTNYAAAKGGMIGFTKSLARELGTRAITVNTVAPGFIDTDMTRALPEEQRQALLQSIPLNRLGSVDEVAHAVAFLASPGAAYITGETLNVNGGMYMA